MFVEKKNKKRQQQELISSKIHACSDTSLLDDPGVVNSAAKKIAR